MRTLHSVEEEFDFKASVYENNRLSSWYKTQGEQILHVLDPDQHGVILDIGCGTGWLLRQFLKAHPEMEGIGIDLSGRMVDIARQKAKEENLTNTIFIKGEWEGLNLSKAGINVESKGISVIVCVSAFHYFTNPYSAARKIYQCLSENGRFLLLDRAKENSLLTTIWDGLHRVLIRDHVQFYRSTDLHRLLEETGFTEVRIESRIKKYLWKRKLSTSLVLFSAKKPAKDICKPI